MIWVCISLMVIFVILMSLCLRASDRSLEKPNAPSAVKAVRMKSANGNYAWALKWIEEKKYLCKHWHGDVFFEFWTDNLERHHPILWPNRMQAEKWWKNENEENSIWKEDE